MVKKKFFLRLFFWVLTAGALTGCSGEASSSETVPEPETGVETGSETETEQPSGTEIGTERPSGTETGTEKKPETETEQPSEPETEPETETAPPVQTGTVERSLSHPAFLQVMYGGSEAGYDTQIPYHGGDQSWFYNAQTGEGDLILEQQGCGLIAAADAMLYLSLYHAQAETLTAPFVLNPAEPLDYHVYADYILNLRSRTDLFPFSEQFGGVLGTDLASGVRKYAKEQGCPYQVKWGGRSEAAEEISFVNETSARTMLSGFLEPEEVEERAQRFQRKLNTVLYMLQEDIPVVMAVGPFSEIHLYRLPQDGNLEGELEPALSVGAHYFIVTDALVNFDTGSIRMQVETWGGLYVLDYLEFTEETYQGMSYLSDILYIE